MEQKNPGAESPAQAHQLTSWKEIAGHLGVNIRTAQKWERLRGLPVRRSPGRRSRVSADADELNEWRRQVVRVKEQDEHAYRWPLGQGVLVEVRFVGSGLISGHIDLLRDYLELFKKSIG